MKNKSLSSLIPHLILCMSIFLFLFQITTSLDERACEPKICGNTPIKYPFYIIGEHHSSCGFPGFSISCHENIAILRQPNNNFQIQEISYTSRTVHLLDTTIVNLKNGCFPMLNNLSLNTEMFTIDLGMSDLLLFSNCSSYPGILSWYKTGCDEGNEHGNGMGIVLLGNQELLSYAMGVCKVVVLTKVKFEENDGFSNYLEVLKRGIVVKWSRWIDYRCSFCETSGGSCGYESYDELDYNFYDAQFHCFCPGGDSGVQYCKDHGQENKKDNLSTVIIGVCSGIGALFFVIGGWCFYIVATKEINKRRKQKFFKQNGGLLLKQNMSSSDGNVNKTKVFNSLELEKATDHFNENRVLGQGGQGTVYKGILSDGRLVAVKKSKIIDMKNAEQFINEVVILSQINQRNIVKLLGCCLETKVPLLVYEFISNGTLYQHIHNPDEEFPLTWEIRLRIAKEVAGALSYMHSAASMPIYHRDIKSTNILLDDKYKAKVCDFGTSRSVDLDKTHFTTRVQGTFGYLDPEYFRSSQFTEKSDVYSFGVVLVELLTGFKPIFSSESQEIRGLAAYFLQVMEEDRFLEIIDSRISNKNKIEEIVMVAHLAKQCLHLNGRRRPTMKYIAGRLEGIGISQEQYMPEENFEVCTSHGIDITEDYDAYSSSPETTN